MLAQPGSPALRFALAFATALYALAAGAAAQSPFTYQGQLRQNGQPANGTFTISFSLYDAATEGNQIGNTLAAQVAVTDGLFTRELDFGPNAFEGAAERWLEVQVNANPPMAPRAKVNAAPEAHIARSLRLPFGVLVNLPGPACVFEITNNGAGPAICGTNTSATGTGLVGKASGNGQNIGVHGRTESANPNAAGVYGEARGGGTAAGVWGFTDTTTSLSGAVFGSTAANAARTYGVWGRTRGTAPSASGVYGEALNGGATNGVYGFNTSNADNATGVFGLVNAGSGNTKGVWGDTFSTSAFATGVFGRALGATGRTYGVRGESASNDSNAAGVFGEITSAAGQGVGVWGRTNSPQGYGGYFNNSAGGTALWADGKCRTQCVQIDGGCDVAEPFGVTSPKDGVLVQAGMVASIDPGSPGRLRLSDAPYDATVAGIISGANGVSPGMVLQGDPGSNALGDVPVALTGRVYCWCDASYGAIKPGDRLTTSSTPGHAMRVSDVGRAPGAVIGKAMSALSEGRGFVLVLVQPQ